MPALHLRCNRETRSRSPFRHRPSLPFHSGRTERWHVMASSPDVSTSLTELLDRALAGDREAENRLFAALHARILAVAKRRIRDDQQAQDLTQDVLRTAFEKYRDAEPGHAFLPWLFTILRNKIGNHMRHRRVKTRLWGSGRRLPRWTGSSESTHATAHSATTPEVAAARASVRGSA